MLPSHPTWGRRGAALAGSVGGIAPDKTCRVLRRSRRPGIWEFIYRPAFELGRHIIGYEIQKVLAAIDSLAAQTGHEIKTGVIGWGEGGLLAFYAAALDTRVAAVCVSGCFGNRLDTWRQPLDRNVFGLLEQFGDPEAMIAPRSLVVEAALGPELTLRGGGGWRAAERFNGAPAVLESPRLEAVRAE